MAKNQSVSLPHCQQDPSVDGRKSCATNGNQISDTVNMEEPHKCGRNGRICVLSRRSSGQKITWNGIFGAAEKKSKWRAVCPVGLPCSKKCLSGAIFFPPQGSWKPWSGGGEWKPRGFIVKYAFDLMAWTLLCLTHTYTLHTSSAWQGHKQLATIWQYRQYMERCRIFMEFEVHTTCILLLFHDSCWPSL